MSASEEFIGDEELQLILNNAACADRLLDELAGALKSGDAERLTVAARAVSRNRQISDAVKGAEELKAVAPDGKRSEPSPSLFPEGVVPPVHDALLELILRESQEHEDMLDELDEALRSGDPGDLQRAAEGLTGTRAMEVPVPKKPRKRAR